jgi:hypothetical protein
MFRQSNSGNIIIDGQILFHSKNQNYVLSFNLKVIHCGFKLQVQHLTYLRN